MMRLLIICGRLVCVMTCARGDYWPQGDLRIGGLDEVEVYGKWAVVYH